MHGGERHPRIDHEPLGVAQPSACAGLARLDASHLHGRLLAGIDGGPGQLDEPYLPRDLRVDRVTRLHRGAQLPVSRHRIVCDLQ